MTLIQTEISGFDPYPKIETLFERDKATFVVDPSKLKASVLGTIREWDVTEKIDGTNIRVMLSEAGEVSFGGRTNAAQIPGDLVQYLIRTFQQDRLKSTMWIDGTPTEAVLYGEGYGPGIQKGGGLYRPDKAFILFDVLITTRSTNPLCIFHGTSCNVTPSLTTVTKQDGSGDSYVVPATLEYIKRNLLRDGWRRPECICAKQEWWLDRESVDSVAQKLAIDVVPYLGRMTIDQIVERVRSPFPSKLGTAMAEGVVARPIETLFDKRMERVIIKLKTKDFISGKR